MAETVHLKLKTTTGPIEGESTQTSMGRENTIECVSFEHSVQTAREAGSAMATGRRQYTPIVVRKRIDKATPLLAKALGTNEVLEGEFLFFRPNPAGDGKTQQFFTVKINNARLSSIRHVVPDTMEPARHAVPPCEELAFVFETIEWKYVPNGAGHVDSWQNG